MEYDNIMKCTKRNGAEIKAIVKEANAMNFGNFSYFNFVERILSITLY